MLIYNIIVRSCLYYPSDLSCPSGKENKMHQNNSKLSSLSDWAWWHLVIKKNFEHPKTRAVYWTRKGLPVIEAFHKCQSIRARINTCSKKYSGAVAA